MEPSFLNDLSEALSLLTWGECVSVKRTLSLLAYLLIMLVRAMAKHSLIRYSAPLLLLSLCLLFPLAPFPTQLLLVLLHLLQNVLLLCLVSPSSSANICQSFYSLF